MRTLPRRLNFRLLGLILSALHGIASAESYTWDANANAADGINNGSGTWNTTTANWRNSTTGLNETWANTYDAIAQFGNGARENANTISLGSATIKAGGLNFLALTPVPATAGQQYTLNTGVLDLGAGSIITLADGSSNGSQFVTFGTAMTIQGSNITMRKAGGTVIQFATLAMASNPLLTGTFTIGGANGGIFMRANPLTLGAVDKIVVENNSTLSTIVGGTFSRPMELAGYGGVNQYGAIRVDGNNTTFSGNLLLTADAGIQTNTGNITGTIITGVISEATPGLSFTRFATGAGVGTLALTAANTYSGATNLGRNGLSGAITILDFAATNAPTSDILYNNGLLTAGALNLVGGGNSSTILNLVGKAGTNNSQRFGNVVVSGTRSAITLTSGASGSMSLTMGTITRTSPGLFSITAPKSGTITVGNGNGFLGPWASYTNAAGITGWAGVTNNTLTHFTGDTPYVTGQNIGALPATVASHLEISAASSGSVLQGAGITYLSTVSMTDPADRTMTIGVNNTLRLGTVGGIQLLGGAGGLTVGEPGNAGTLSAGGSTLNTPGQLILTNGSTTQPLVINSAITNNGTTVGAVTLLIQGAPGSTTALAGSNSYTGGTTIASGSLEMRHGGALGTSGTITVLENAALKLSGGISVTRNISIAGSGVASEGVVRNLSGANTITGLLSQLAPTRLVSDSGTLTLHGATAATAVLTGNFATTFAGAGDFIIDARIGSATTSTIAITKDGTGTLTLQGSNNNSGITTLIAGTLHLDFAAANAPETNIMYNGLAAAGALTQTGGDLKITGKSGSTISQSFGAYTVSNASSITVAQNAAASVTLNFGAITRNTAATLKLTLPTTGFITTTSGSTTVSALLTGTGGVAYATAGLNDWAATTPTAVSTVRNIVGLSSFNGYTSSTATGLTASANIDAAVALTTLTADASIASLRFNQNLGGLTTITQDATQRILTTGGILVTPAVGANDVLISTGTLRAPTGAADLIIFQNNTAGALRIRAKITNNAGGTVTNFIKSGPGTVIIESSANYSSGPVPTYYTGSTRVHEGVLQFTTTTGGALTYPINPGTDFYLGSGTLSGKVVIGSGTVGTGLWGGLRIDGTGTANALVGGATTPSTFHHYVSTVHDFRKGFIGGSGTNENNLHLTLSQGTLQLGPDNTFNGKTTILTNTIEVEKLANTGLPSSLGTGNSSAANSIIDMATQTTNTANYTALATLRHIGSTDSVTNRVVNLTNSDPEHDVPFSIAALENTGTGTVKFTSAFTAGGANNQTQRIFRLGGTNTGANEIVSITDTTTVGAKTVQLEKVGTGTWILTGNSTHSGGTTVSEGTLLVRNSGSLTSATGSGPVTVLAGAVLGGEGRIALGLDKSITLTGGTISIGNSTLSTPTASTLELVTSGTGTITLDTASAFALDLIARSGVAEISGASDMAKISGRMILASGATLTVGNPTSIQNFAAGDQWKLFDWSGLSTPMDTSFTNVNLPSLSGMEWDLSRLYTDGVISIAMIPEPSRVALLLMAFIAIAGRRRR